LDPDADDDGISDGIEVTAGTDPADDQDFPYRGIYLRSDTTDGSVIFTDESGFSHAVTANGNVHHASAGTDTAVLFDSTGDYLSLANSSDWDFGTGDFTIDLWVNMTSAVDYGGILSTCQYAGIGYMITIKDGNFQWYHPATDWLDTEIASAIGTWQHLAVVRSGSVLTLYVDGVVTPASATVSGEINSQGSGLVIGKLFPALNGWYFDGYMDEIKVSKGEARWTTDFAPPNNPAP